MRNRHIERYTHVVKLDHLSVVKRRKFVTERFEILHDLCDSYDKLSEIEKKNQLFKYLGLFSRKDNVPDEYYDDTDSDTEYTE